MVASGIELAISEGQMQWLEHFQIQRIHCLQADGQLSEAGKELDDYSSQAAARQSVRMVLLCKLLEVQLILQQGPGWSKSKVEAMLSSC